MFKPKFFFIAIFLFLEVLASGQTSKETQELNKWTFGVILMSEHDPLLKSSFRPHFFNGVVVKRNLNFLSIRLGIEHVNYLYEHDDFPVEADCFYYDGFTSETSVRLGIEKGITVKKFFYPYIALDLSGSGSYSNWLVGGGYTGLTYRTHRDSYSVGVNPAIGISFKLSKAFSISLETRFQMIYVKYNQEEINLTDDHGIVSYETDYFYKSLNRIGALTLNYSF